MKANTLENADMYGLNDISETMPLRLARQIRVPLFWENVPAGAPEHIEGYIDEYVDFYKHFFGDPKDGYIVRVSGESMRGANIRPGDLLFVDRGANPKSGDIVIADVNGMKTVKRLRINGNAANLTPENPAYQPLVFRSLDEIDIWGVVTYVVSRPR